MLRKSYFVLVLILYCYVAPSHQKIGCKDEKNKDVAWFINYKLPKIDSEPSGSDLNDGEGYAYIRAPGSSTWRLSDKSIKSGSMLHNTMQNFYSEKEDLTYLFYNDDPPNNFSGSAVGHLKGVVAFDGNTGFWLIHSIPKFTSDDRFEYPDNALVNGQSILCVSFKTEELNEICNQLLYCHPNIFARKLTSEVQSQLDNNAQSLFAKNPKFVREPLTRKASLKSLDQKVFRSFAKDNQYEEDIYSNVIAPDIKSSLVAETWRRGSGTFLPPYCRETYYVLDVVTVNMTVSSKRNLKNIFFKSTEDHSKWAVSDGKKNWICIGDLNRMESQAKRGGGAVCFESSPVRKAFDSIVASVDECPISK